MDSSLYHSGTSSVLGKLYTVAQIVQWQMLDDANRTDLLMASATSAIIPTVILFVLCQKYFVEGIATSGVKG